MAIPTPNPTRRSASLILAGMFAFLGLFAGLCTIFAGVVTIAEGWREHVQAAWPQTTARIEKCTVAPYKYGRSHRNTVWRIDCRVSYVLGAEEVATKIRSRTAPLGADASPLDDWVADHPPQSSVVLRYDPSNHRNALPAAGMPYTGPRSPGNLRLLLIFAVGCVVLLALARLLGKRHAAVPAA